MFTRVFYISKIAEGLTDAEVQIIPGVAQVNHRRLDVTGMRAQSDGHFTQLLGGRSDVTRSLVDRIATDLRHRRVRMLLQDAITTRPQAGRRDCRNSL